MSPTGPRCLQSLPNESASSCAVACKRIHRNACVTSRTRVSTSGTARRPEPRDLTRTLRRSPPAGDVAGCASRRSPPPSSWRVAVGRQPPTVGSSGCGRRRRFAAVRTRAATINSVPIPEFRVCDRSRRPAPGHGGVRRQHTLAVGPVIRVGRTRSTSQVRRERAIHSGHPTAGRSLSLPAASSRLSG